MGTRGKRIFKSIGNTLLSCLITAVAISILYYAVNGWQIAGNLRASVEKGNIVSVKIVQNDYTVTVTEPEKIALAAGCAQILRVNLPAKESDVTPDTNFVFEYKNGKTVQIGATDKLVIKDGKAYSPKGEGGSVKTFINCTEGIFFLDKALN